MKPSPIVWHSAPRSLKRRTSPEPQLPDFTNWTMHTAQPRPRARSAVPIAAVVLPLPSPVAISTIEAARVLARGGAVVGGSVFGVWRSHYSGPHFAFVARCDALAPYG